MDVTVDFVGLLGPIHLATAVSMNPTPFTIWKEQFTI